jgi:hypothetical protein
MSSCSVYVTILRFIFTAIIVFLNITHGPAFIYNNVSETGPYLRPQIRNQLSWAHSIELVPISGHQNQRERRENGRQREIHHLGGAETFFPRFWRFPGSARSFFW